MISLAGKKALVTGSGRGIGREIALKLAAAGADVAITDVDLDSARQTSKDIEALGRRSIAIQADVSNQESVQKLFETCVADFGAIEILVNNAGITRDNLLIRMSEADWDMVLSVNLKSVFLCCKEAMRPMMKAKYGRIVNISSVIGLMGNAAQANYAAAKAGMIGVTKSLAKEYAVKNITVNAVAPGFIQSAMTDKLAPEIKQKYIEHVPLARLGTPEDVANAVVFLVSPLADYITGQVLTVDGGMVM
jgi:3-oxoacyl-[acyl-carrier protein] reductase